MAMKDSKRTSMASLRDVAEKAQLSTGTVSRVLNNHSNVAHTTRMKVKRAMRELNYRPNLLMHGLRTGKTRTIGVLMPVHEWFYAQVFRGINQELGSQDHLAFLSWPDNRTVDEELHHIHRLIERRVDGIIIRSSFASVTDERLNEAWQNHVPVVAVDHELPLTHADFVGIDDEAGARIVAEHLLKLGHRHFGHFGGAQMISTGRLRREAFEQAVKQVPEATCVTVVSEEFGPDFKLAIELLQKTPRPTAIFAANDFLAEVLYRAASKLGLSIPDDLSVVGFSNLDFAGFLNPPLTTVHHSPRKIGQEAARRVLQLGQETKVGSDLEAWSPWKVRLMPRLIMRDSTGPVKD